MSGMFVPPFRAWELLCQEGEERDLCGYLCAHTRAHTRTCISKLCLSVCVLTVFVGSVATGHVKKGERETSPINDPPVDLCFYSGFTRTPGRTWFWFPWFIAVQKHTVMVSNSKLSFPHSLAPLFPVLCSGAPAPALPLPPVPTPHSPCLWDTPFIYFFIKLQRSLRLISCGPGGTESTLGVSQGLARVETDARGPKLGVASGWWRRDGPSSRECPVIKHL